MNYQEFIGEVKALNLNWFVIGKGYIRCRNGDCPITALIRAKKLVKYPNNMKYRNQGIKLGLSNDDINSIILESDNPNFYSNLYKALINK